MEAASSEEAIAVKSIGANTFHHIIKNSIKIEHQRLLISQLIMMDTLSRIFRLPMMVELVESILREKCISHDELAQIDRHRKKSIFFLKEQLSSTLSHVYMVDTLSGGGIYGGHSLTDILSFGDSQAG